MLVGVQKPYHKNSEETQAKLSIIERTGDAWGNIYLYISLNMSFESKLNMTKKGFQNIYVLTIFYWS